MATSSPVLCLVTDARLAREAGVPLASLVGRAAAAGLDWVQLRDRESPGAELLETARAIRAAAPHVCLLVNRRVDVALAAGADGVHLGFDALPPEAARSLLGEGARIGASCHGVEEVRSAHPALDYVHLAPIFPPLSKPAERPPLGLEALQAAGGRLPVLAQGGITARNARACIAAGAAGVAVTGEILSARDPAEATRALRKALDA